MRPNRALLSGVVVASLVVVPLSSASASIIPIPGLLGAIIKGAIISEAFNAVTAGPRGYYGRPQGYAGYGPPGGYYAPPQAGYYPPPPYYGPSAGYYAPPRYYAPPPYYGPPSSYYSQRPRYYGYARGW